MATNVLIPSLPRTALAEKADLVFKNLRGFQDEGERNHHLRIYAFACHLLSQGGQPFDRALLYYIAMLHENSLARRHGKGRGVFARSLELLTREASGFGLDESRRRILKECVYFKYRLIPPAKMTPEAAAFRRAIIIEISRGIFAFGLPAMQVLAVFRHHARWAFDRKLVSWWMELLAQAPFSLFVRRRT